MKLLIESWKEYLKETPLQERGNPSEDALQRAVLSFLSDQMGLMQLNPGDPADRQRIKASVQGVVDLAIEQFGLNEDINK
jgi:hypothetical protein